MSPDPDPAEAPAMAPRTERRWIERELPALVEAGVVPAEVADRIRAHYASATPRSPLPLFAVLGAGLIGLGVVLLLAANWDTLSRPLRAGLCFAMLLGAQGVAGFALVRERASTSWSEATALGLSLAAAAATALVAQTYQVQGDLRGFLSTWLLLCFALPYLFDARGVAALYLLAAGGWLALSLGEGGSRHLFWLFLGLLAPYLHGLSGGTAGALRNAFLATVAVAVIGFGAVAGFRVGRWDVVVWIASLVAAGIHALGALGRGQGRHAPWLVGPSSALAGLGIAVALVFLGYRDAWRFVGEAVGGRGAPSFVDHVGAAVVTLAFGALALGGAARWLRAGDWPRALVAGFPLVVGAGILATLASEPGGAGRHAAPALAGLSALALGVGTTLAGLGRADLRRANTGLVLLAALIFTRFADWNLSFTLRGLVFIGFGAGFLLLNLRLRRLRGDATAAGGST